MLLTLTGGAGAGKTTLAAALAATAPQLPVSVLHGDDYYFTEPDRGVWRPDETGTLRLDVGDPRSIDSDRLNAAAATALTASAVVIVEGLFAHHTSPPGPHDRFGIFVDLPADIRLARKIRRKCIDGSFPIEILLANYLNHRRDAHLRHIEPARERCDLIVKGELSPDFLATEIWQRIDFRAVHKS